MGPNQNLGAVAPQNKPAASENIMAQGISAKKSNKGMIFGMIILAILAIGGVGFGVWAWMDGNTQKDTLNSQIADLKAKNTELLERIGDEGETGILDGYKNPVIKSTAERSYSPYETFGNITISIEDSSISSCRIVDIDENCEISGVVGEVYDVTSFTHGQDESGAYFGFIMVDGTVKYVSYTDIIDDHNAEAKKLNIDGYVVNIINMDDSAAASGIPDSGVNSVFILSDGSYLVFDESMLD